MDYRGPFSIDAFIYKENNKIHFQPLSEVNARMSFGLVARAWAEQTNRSPFRFTI